MEDLKNSLVPLCTNLITLNRDYVVFIGAGFSKDAGIESSWDILLETLKPLYIAQLEVAPDQGALITHAEIEKWYLTNDKINKLGYSEILEIMHKGEIERREYLASFFKSKQPGEAHRELAKLVSMGVIRFIFTTNFDDLLEKALSENNVDYDVIFSDDILQTTKSWDKVKQCRIYKLHGDYKTGKLRNTVEELKQLDEKMASDFQYIIDRHGLIVIGYAGRDSGIMAHLIERKPYSYPFYWQYVSQPPENSEYKLFYELKRTFEKKSCPIVYLQNKSASGFLKEIREGIEKANIFIKMSEANEPKFDSFVIEYDSKKLRNLSYQLLNNFYDIYNSHRDREDKDRQYSYKYEVFESLINESSFIFSYIDSLLKYNSDEEINFFLRKVVEHCINFDWGMYNSEFIRLSYVYIVISMSGALMIKYEKFSLLDIFWCFQIFYSRLDQAYLMSVISYTEDGWEYIAQQKYQQRFYHPRYWIIRNKLRVNQLTESDFDRFDSYATLSCLIEHSSCTWVNGSASFHNDSFVYIYTKLYSELVKSDDKLIAFQEEFYQKYSYVRNRGGDSFQQLIGFIKNQLRKTKISN